MFFCPICNNSYDITKPSKEQKGGADSESPMTVSSEAGLSVDQLVQKAIDRDDIEASEIASFKIDDLKKSAEYKRLGRKDKELVYNLLHDRLPSDKKAFRSSQTRKNIALFSCGNCGHIRPIDDGTLIYSRSFGGTRKSDLTVDYSNRVESDVLLRTRRYSCVNSSCPSHSDSTKRMAVMYRLSDSGFHMGYTCTACRTSQTV